MAGALTRRPLSQRAPRPAEAPPSRPSVLVAAFFAAPVAAGLWVVAWVEALSALGAAGSRTAWGLFWVATAALAAAGFAAVRRAERTWFGPMPKVAALAVPGTILAATFVVALVAAPNNWDSMTYHNARVMEWWDHGSIAPWDTRIDRQLRMPPLASYFKLALLGLTGNDVLFSLVQWAFFAFSMLAAAALAARLVPTGRAGPWAALLVATIPMAILQSTSTQNDVVVAGYLLAAAFFLIRAFAVDGAPARNLALAGAAVGLAFATKGTAYILAAPFLAAAGRCRPRENRARAGAGAPDMGRGARGGGRPHRPPERRLLVAKCAGPRFRSRLRPRSRPPVLVPRPRPPESARPRGLPDPSLRGSAAGSVSNASFSSVRLARPRAGRQPGGHTPTTAPALRQSSAGTVAFPRLCGSRLPGLWTLRWG